MVLQAGACNASDDVYTVGFGCAKVTDMARLVAQPAARREIESLRAALTVS
jgi:hypothetical protein